MREKFPTYNEILGYALDDALGKWISLDIKLGAWKSLLIVLPGLCCACDVIGKLGNREVRE